jgi:hypothetical protein
MEAGYDISDPKHPRHHSVHADLWDSRDKTFAENRRNPLVHFEFTVLDGVSEMFATNSLPLAVQILERMSRDNGLDLGGIAIIAQSEPGEWPRSLSYTEAVVEAAD